MEEKIEREDLIDIQKELTDTSNELAENVNKKYILDAGIKKVLKPSIFLLALSIISTLLLPTNLFTIILWLLTGAVGIPTFAYGVRDISTNLKVKDLKTKIKYLNELKRSMELDYEIGIKKQERLAKTKTDNADEIVKENNEVVDCKNNSENEIKNSQI